MYTKMHNWKYFWLPLNNSGDFYRKRWDDNMMLGNVEWGAMKRPHESTSEWSEVAKDTVGKYQ